MSTINTTDPREAADLKEAQRLFEAGQPFPPELSRRIQERAEKLSQETLERTGLIDLDKILHDK